MTEREHNRLRVLKALRRAEPIGRTDLANLCGLDGGTITEISSTLLRRGLVLEEKVPTGKRGRPQMHLRLNPDGTNALVAYIGINGRLHCEIVNLRGDQLFIASRPLAQLTSMEMMSEVLASTIADVIINSGLEKSAISRVGIALPAVVDSERGIIHWVQTFAVSPFPAARLIEDRLGIPVLIDNNTNVLARAEHWFGDHGEVESFSLVNIGYGISAAHYVNGTLHAGAHGLNSELGHSKIVADAGRLCSCGSWGCLDAYCSIGSLVAQSREALSLKQGSPSGLSNALTEFVDRWLHGEARLRDVFDRASRYMAVAIGNHINSFDPGRVIILCEHPAMIAIYQNSLEMLDNYCLPPMRGLTKVELRSFEQELFRKGSAALVLEQLYKSL